MADSSTWGSSQFPLTLQALRDRFIDYDIDYLSMLHTIGVLTTPTVGTGGSLAEYWAQLRYLHAVDMDSDYISLCTDYADMDPHQKSILSDDFGVGLPIYFLKRALKIRRICDGIYFKKNLASRLRARISPKTSKHGPGKTPDFVMEDANGKYHILECKGTQSADSDRIKQLTAGLSQKRSFKMPAAIAGERLVTGTRIRQAESNGRSDILIHDPDYEHLVILEESDRDIIDDPIYRGMTARALSLIGARSLANQVASPQGMIERPLDERWADRHGFLQRRQRAADAELLELESRATTRGDEVERVLNVELAQPVQWRGRAYTQATVRYSCSRELLEQARMLGDRPDPLGSDVSYWREASAMSWEEPTMNAGAESVAAVELTAVLRIGSMLTAELRLH